MVKNKGIWIVIGSILVIGIFVTFVTSSFVKNKESIPDSAEEYQAQAYEEDQLANKTPELLSADSAGPMGPETIDNGTSVTQNQKPSTGGVRLKTARKPGQDQALQKRSENPETVMPREPVISPNSPDTKIRLSDAQLAEGAAYYQKHLAELDTQIEKMRKESLSTNTYSMKVLADKELELWDREQTVIYNVVLERLSDKEKTALKVSQQAWTKSRDAKAEEAAQKYSGGSLEELEYTASLAESSRARAYNLVTEYKDVLSLNEGK